MGLSTPGLPAFPDDAEHEVMVLRLPQVRIDFAALTKLVTERAQAQGKV
jgi:hypothetical protein